MPKEDTQFKKGVSGNPLGRGLNVISRKDWMDKMLTEDKRKQLFDVAYDKALGGKLEILQFLLSRVLPPAPLDDTVDIELRNKSHRERGDEIFAALSDKKITPAQAHMLFASLCDNVKLVEMTEIVERISKLEEASSNANAK